MVIWTPRARADPKSIHDIAKDSRQNAQKVAREILHKADALAEPPRPGRTVPEINDPGLREISAYSWRGKLRGSWGVGVRRVIAKRSKA